MRGAMPKRVVSVVTLYNPTREHIAHTYLFAEQSDVTIVLDNSPVSNRHLFESITPTHALLYTHNSKNLGLSKAFNLCLHESSDFTWNADDYVIFFDQDTLIVHDHIRQLIAEYERLAKHGYAIGCLGPVYFDTSTQKKHIPKLHKRVSRSTIAVSKIITTSMVTQYKTLQSVGFWNEDMFLDLADYDLCWRMRKAGLHIFMTSASIIVHNIGDSSASVFSMHSSESKPFREYYQMRDRLYLLHSSYVPVANRLILLAEVTACPLLRLIVKADRGERLRYMMLGISHYQKRIHGSL